MELCYLSRETPTTALQDERRCRWQLAFCVCKRRTSSGINPSRLSLNEASFDLTISLAVAHDFHHSSRILFTLGTVVEAYSSTVFWLSQTGSSSAWSTSQAS